MSFILDALKKSETERQQQGGAEFASVPTSDARPRRNAWIWIVGVLLAVNLAVMLGILLRPAAVEPAASLPELPAPTPAASGTVASGAVEPAAAAQTTFANQVATALETRPQPVAEQAVEPSASPAVSEPAPAVAAPAQAPARDSIPTIDELRLAGSIDLPELRIDIHVYSENAAERFVFINMNKQRENSILAEGPAVREIRRDGVVLEHRGQVFLLPRR